jgi:Uma2 family endonuclease
MSTVNLMPSILSENTTTFMGGALSPAVVTLPVTWDYDTFREWAQSDEAPEKGDLLFYEGEVEIDMSPENFDTHNFAKARVHVSLDILNREQKLGVLFLDGCLVSVPESKLSTTPDLAFASHASLKSGRIQFRRSKTQPTGHTEMIGAPDWVLEVVSASSVRKDTKTLRTAYYKAGVTEYWLIDARDEDIEFKLLVRGPKGFVEQQSQDDWRHSPVFGCEFRLLRETDQYGLMNYMLESRPRS